MCEKNQRFSKKLDESLADEETRLIAFLNQIEDELELFDYLIAHAAEIPTISQDERKEEYLVNGCQTKIWIKTFLRNGYVAIEFACDSLLIKGVLALLVSLLTNRKCGEVLDYEMRFVKETDIRYLLSVDRRRGMDKVLKKMKQDLKTQLVC